MDKLTPHFSIKELTASITAERLGIDNTPPDDVMENILLVAEKLEIIRSAIGFPINIMSGYRSLGLNRAVGGSDNSVHMVGLAADIISFDLGSAGLLAAYILDLSEEIEFDQLILENNTWVHLGFCVGESPRGEALTFLSGIYHQGILLLPQKQSEIKHQPS